MSKKSQNADQDAPEELTIDQLKERISLLELLIYEMKFSSNEATNRVECIIDTTITAMKCPDFYGRAYELVPVLKDIKYIVQESGQYIFEKAIEGNCERDQENNCYIDAINAWYLYEERIKNSVQDK